VGVRENGEDISIDPRDFIRPPFISCPKCGEAAFGVVAIQENRYFRRCKSCLYPSFSDGAAVYPLPSLKKRIIYLDQFAIIEMAKVLHPVLKMKRKGPHDEFWITLFRKLDSLIKLQLIICPYSEFHEEESLISKDYSIIKKMYEYLSYGIRFDSMDQIRKEQLYSHAQNWYKGDFRGELQLDIGRVFVGNIDGWLDRFFISSRLAEILRSKDEIKKNREERHNQFLRVFERWQEDKNKTFEEIFLEESNSYIITILEQLRSFYVRHLEILNGKRELSLEDILPDDSVEIVFYVIRALENAGVPEKESLSKSLQYFKSLSNKYVPFSRISSMLFSAIARKARSGQKELPSEGTITDVEMISTLLPYCDAMFIDKQCHSLLSEAPLCDEVDFETRLFSLNNKDEFLDYLEGIEHQVSQDHFEKVKEVYGEDWLIPNTSLFA
jgi:hypothetical protein